MKCMVPIKSAFQWNSRNASKFWPTRVFPISFQNSAVLPFSPFLKDAWSSFTPSRSAAYLLMAPPFLSFSAICSIAAKRLSTSTIRVTGVMPSFVTKTYVAAPQCSWAVNRTCGRPVYASTRSEKGSTQGTG